MSLEAAIETIITEATPDQRRMLLSVLGEKFDPGQPRDDNGQFASGGGGGSAGAVSETDHIDKFGNSNRPAAYAKIDTGTKTVKIAENGQIKLSRPKNAEEGMAQLKAMEKILDAAQKDAAGNLPKVHKIRAELAVYHATQQMKRALAFGHQIVAASKASDSDLTGTISRLEAKYKIKAMEDPGDEDFVFGES